MKLNTYLHSDDHLFKLQSGSNEDIPGKVSWYTEYWAVQKTQHPETPVKCMKIVNIL